MNAKILCALIIGLLTVSCFPFVPSIDSKVRVATALAMPSYDGGYGYDASTATMYDHNGFRYSYLPDGIIKLTLPWGYVTYFSFGMTGSYLGVAQKVSALDYTWTWVAEAEERFNETGVSQGYDYTFTATNSETLDWTIQLDFSPIVGEHMKVTHTVVNGYPNALTGVEFWYLLDLTHTPDPCVTTNLGTYYPPLYSVLPDSVTWLRLSNQFQFDWRDADYPNGHAYLGDGSVVGVDVDILGVSLVLGDILPGGSRVIDPYFSGVTRTWAALGASDSNTASNWSPAGVPSTGDNITFDATSVFDCVWNTAVTLGTFSMNVGYSGTVTQSTTFSVYNVTFAAGTFASVTCWLNVGNTWLRSNTVMMGGMFNLTGAGAGAASTMTNTGAELAFRGLVISQYTDIISGTFSPNELPTVRILTGATLELSAGVVMKIFDITSTLMTWSNLGEITGAGELYFITYGASNNFTPGVITTPLIFRSYSTAGASGTLTLSGPLTCGALTIRATESATYSVTINLAGQSLSSSSITLLTRGILIAGSSVITDRGAWSSSAGTFTPGTSTVTLSGTGSTVTTGTGQSFYNFITSGTYTTASSVDVTHNLTVSGGLTIGAGKTIDWNTTDGEFSNTGTIAGTGTLALTMQDDYPLTLGTVTCPTIIRKAVGTTGTHTVALAVDTELASDFTVESGIDLDPNDKVVTIVDDLELDLPSPSSLWNVTVEAGVTVTLTVDVIAELRVTILGTVTGADFIEPLSAFTSVPATNLYLDVLWEYEPTQAYWDAFAYSGLPDWMIWTGTEFRGIPNATGFYEVSLNLTWNDMVTWQNFTLTVEGEEPFVEFDFLFLFMIQILFLTMNIISYVATQTRIMTLFVILGEAILCIPTILAFESYYWVAILLIIINTVMATMSAHINKHRE